MCKEKNTVLGVDLKVDAVIEKIPVYLSERDEYPVYVTAYKDCSTLCGATVFIFKCKDRWWRFTAPEDYQFVNLYGDHYKPYEYSEKNILIAERGVI